MRSIRSILNLYPEAAGSGLNATQTADSLSRYGVNKLTPLPKEPIWKKFLEKFDEPIIKILLAASLLKIVVDLFAASASVGGVSFGIVLLLFAASWIFKLGDWLPSALFGLALILVGLSAGLGHPSYEGLAVMLAVALATGVAFFSEYRSDQEFEKLNEHKDSARVKVMREGSVRTLPLEEVLVGDLIELETGDEIPADGRIVRANELMIDQSLMTGEAEPVRKSAQPEADEAEGPDQPGCVYRGTQVVDGLGEMMITNVGDDTMLGQLARRLSSSHVEPENEADANAVDARIQRKLTLSKNLTPLQQKLAVLANTISKIGYIAAILIFFTLLIRGIFFSLDATTGKHEIYWPANSEEFLGVVQHLLAYVVYMVIIIVVAVPEGLPMSVTVSLALAMRKMTRANALVRQLEATETIGSATVICSDKTGTLTQNKMRVVRLVFGNASIDSDDLKFHSCQVRPSDPSQYHAIRWLALNAAMNSTATLEEKNGKTMVIGSSTEGALLYWLRESGCDSSGFRNDHSSLFRIAFSSEHKKMVTIVSIQDRLTAFVKGAPEIILERCNRIMQEDGSVLPMTASHRQHVASEIERSAHEAMRTLAFAQKELPADFPRVNEEIQPRREELSEDLIFCGFVAIRDPLREDVVQAVAECRSAGIEVKMITGDNLETARAIAKEIGLLDSPNAFSLTSAEFNALSDDELKQRMPNLKVLARARPLDKYRLVGLLQEQEHVVAMTGDGTNDAPSLKKADVGLSMGISGTEVAKEASKIVLLDDSFSTIVKSVHWGRALYENIQRFIQFQLTINVSALLIAFLGPFFGLKPPFTVLQLLWINVIMDTFAAIALCSEPPRKGLMQAKPKRRNEHIITKTMLGNILLTASFYVVVMMVLLKGMESFGWFVGEGAQSHEFPELSMRQITIFFTAYVFFQIWNQINCRSLSPKRSGLRGLLSNPIFLAIASLTLLGQMAIVRFGYDIFEVEPLAVMDWLVIAGATTSVLVFAEITRIVRLLRMKRTPVEGQA